MCPLLAVEVGAQILSLFMLILNDTDTCDFNDLRIFAVDAG